MGWDEREFKINDLRKGELRFGRWDLVTPGNGEIEEWGGVRLVIREARTVKEEVIYILK